MSSPNSIENQHNSRRKFISELGSLFALSAVAISYPWFKSFGDSMNTTNEKSIIAIIGTGSRGRYLQSILSKNPKVEIKILCDNYEPSLQEALKISPQAKTETDYCKVLENKEIDAVVIATPLHEHAHMCIASFDAGKHVFCEKSMALTPIDTLKMYKTYRKSGKVFYIGQQRMFDIRYLKGIEMIKSGMIGNICKVNTFWYRNSNWRRNVPSPDLERKLNWRLYKEYSCGLMTELATHQLQVGNWAIGAIPNQISGFGSLVHWKDGRDVYDNVSVRYQYPNGELMTFDSFTGNKKLGMEEQILGTKGSIEFEKGKYFMEAGTPAPALLQLINDIEHKLFTAIPIGGPSWVPETANNMDGEYILGKKSIGDGSEMMLESFVESVITGKPILEHVEASYYSSILSLFGEMAMRENKIINFPEEFKI